MEFSQNPMKEIRISTTANDGYLVYVGCVHFAYTDEEKMIADLGEYIRDPKGIEDQYNKHHKAYDEIERAPRSLGQMMPETESVAPPEREPDEAPQEARDMGY